jgi:hypothetical protein
MSRSQRWPDHQYGAMATLSLAVKATAPLRAHQLDDVLAEEVASHAAKPARALAYADRRYLWHGLMTQGDRSGDPCGRPAGRRVGRATGGGP